MHKRIYLFLRPFLRISVILMQCLASRFFTYKGQQVDAREVGRQLGVCYVLEGSVRRAHTSVRSATQLFEAETGTHLWADHFDGSLEDVFELQDQIAISVAGVIEPTLQAAETARSRSRATTDLTAYDLFLCALAHSLSYERGRLTQAVSSGILSTVQLSRLGPLSPKV